ncbi:MAG: hypothetical protein ACK5H1_06635, partial [Tenacibaculum sp.]
DHIFTLTSKLKTSLKKGIELYTIPSFNYKSRFALFNNVKPGDPDNFYQNGYGLFNLIAGLHFEQAKIDFSVYSNNLFNKKDYFINGANTGRAYGLPGYVPGIPRTFGLKINYDLTKK